jgi:hypothetical protein
MRWRALIALLSCALAWSAKPGGPADRKGSERNAVLRVPVLLTSGEEIAGAADVTASVYGGEAVRVLRVDTPEDDLLLLIVLDLTGDIALIDPARQSLAQQIGSLPPSTWTGLLRAQDGLQVLQDPTPDPEAIKQALASVSTTGRAGLLETVETAAQLADSIAAKSQVRLAVLYLTDSDVRNYREDFTNPVINSSDSRDLSRRFPEGLVREKISKLTDRLARYQAPVFIVHLAYSSERLNEAYQGGLLQIATATGGTATFCRSVAEIPGAIERTVSSILSLYQVVVQLPAKHAKSVTLVMEAKGRTISYRSRFVLR